MRTFLFGIFSLLVAVQWTESSPAPDPLDTININLNTEEEPGSNPKPTWRPHWKPKKGSRNSGAMPGARWEPEGDYSAMTQHPEPEHPEPEHPEPEHPEPEHPEPEHPEPEHPEPEHPEPEHPEPEHPEPEYPEPEHPEPEHPEPEHPEPEYPEPEHPEPEQGKDYDDIPDWNPKPTWRPHWKPKKDSRNQLEPKGDYLSHNAPTQHPEPEHPEPEHPEPEQGKDTDDISEYGHQMVENQLPIDLLAAQFKCRGKDANKCINSLGDTVLNCVAALDPSNILSCVLEVIHPGLLCYECICAVMENLGIKCPSPFP